MSTIRQNVPLLCLLKKVTFSFDGGRYVMFVVLVLVLLCSGNAVMCDESDMSCCIYLTAVSCETGLVGLVCG